MRPADAVGEMAKGMVIFRPKISVSVELVSRPQPWVRVQPARTVIVRARKTDVDAFTAGKLTKDDLLKRVQTKAY